jgi:O-acetyl-ADP-ribose deacetylase (regulator of RNase III)
MLKVTEGNLWSHAKGQCVIAHGCNTLGSMGKGFAKQLKERYPLNFLEYRQLCLNGRLKVGEWLLVHEKDKAIFNLITQETYGNDKDVVYVDYEAVRKGLQAVELYASQYHLPVHMPFIGAGLAHGDPKILMVIFEEVFITADVVVYLLPSSKGKKHGH